MKWKKEIVPFCYREIFQTGVTKENYIRFFHNLLWYEETIARINLKVSLTCNKVLYVIVNYVFMFIIDNLNDKDRSIGLGEQQKLSLIIISNIIFFSLFLMFS